MGCLVLREHRRHPSHYSVLRSMGVVSQTKNAWRNHVQLWECKDTSMLQLASAAQVCVVLCMSHGSQTCAIVCSVQAFGRHVTASSTSDSLKVLYQIFRGSETHRGRPRKRRCLPSMRSLGSDHRHDGFFPATAFIHVHINPFGGRYLHRWDSPPHS